MFPDLYSIRKFIRMITTSQGPCHESDHVFTHYILIYITIASSQYRKFLQNSLSPSCFPTKTFNSCLNYPKTVICPNNLIVLSLINLMILDNDYKCNFLHPPVTFSLLGPNILIYFLEHPQTLFFP